MRTILQRISDGDEQAINACLDAYGDMVWRLARRYLDRATSDIDDAVQEVFIEIWLSAERFDPDLGGEPAFVATIAHRRLTDFQRKASVRMRTTRKATETIIAESKPVPKPDPTDGPGDTAIEALATLPENEKDTLMLWLYRGFTQRQIGQATEAPLGTVKSRMRRGLTRICEKMAGDAEPKDKGAAPLETTTASNAEGTTDSATDGARGGSA